MNSNDDNKDNQEKGLADIAGMTEEHVNKVLEKYDAYYNLVLLLDKVNKLQPREKWIMPILRSCECQDFKNQLLTAIEDYERGS